MKELSFFDYYLIVINVLGFIFFVINTWLYSYTEEKQIDVVLTFTSLLGGSVGILLSILVFDRKAVKGNMMSRVFIACVFVIQIILFLMIKGYIADELTFKFWKFFNKYKWFLLYLVIINVVAFISFALDKYAAIKHRSRIRIVTLLGMAFFGGSIGGLMSMYIFRHKTSIDYFTVGIPLIMIMQIVVLFYLMNNPWVG